MQRQWERVHAHASTLLRSDTVYIRVEVIAHHDKMQATDLRRRKGSAQAGSFRVVSKSVFEDGRQARIIT